MTLATPLSETGHSMLERVQNLQGKICDAFFKFETEKSFFKDPWQRSETTGGGLSCVFEDGSIFEKAGVNISAITGNLTSETEKMMFQSLINQRFKNSMQLENATYFATGISVVCHPINPFVPTIHMNYRFFEIQSGNETLWWFGGGTDLTPYFLDLDLITQFHTQLKTTCDLFDLSYYPKFKEACDTYFYLPHRKEHRGIGGIFFDYLNTQSNQHYLDFASACGNCFLDTYLPFIETYQAQPYTQSQQEWQQYRRGRYVEFNLLHDRGTHFGLKTNGRIESIFMSLPKRVIWTYDENKLKKDHDDLLKLIKTPKQWA